ncbi:hypothetical protein AKJ09_01226 [Labilithrix luteola]|uniref:Uncharacterized protein n=1 Tax=Labilithrix luteola TaxID=1391654 RepID=A0A0K1PM12_9BACT|nr:hypothetical protein AKJ09_01226 [Labilithrix luteola]
MGVRRSYRRGWLWLVAGPLELIENPHRGFESRQLLQL